MTSYQNITNYTSNLITNMIGAQASLFGFSTDVARRVIAERQNAAPAPGEETIVYYRIDEYNLWKAQRTTANTYFDEDGKEHIHEMRTFKVILNFMSKELGSAFDAARFVIANIQNNRYNEYINTVGELYSIEQIFPMKNLSSLENSVWTERIQVVLQVNMKETIVVDNGTAFVTVPESISDLKDSVDFTLIEK